MIDSEQRRLYAGLLRDALLGAVAIGLLASAVHLIYPFAKLGRRVDERSHALLGALEHSLATGPLQGKAPRALLSQAAWVRSVRLEDAAGRQLARLAVPRAAPRPAWPFELFFGGARAYTGTTTGAGTHLVLDVDRARAADALWHATRGASPFAVFALYFAAALAMALLLLLAAHRRIGRPLLAATRSLMRLTPADLRAAGPRLPAFQRREELERLFSGIDGLLMRVAASLHELDRVNRALHENQVHFQAFLEHAPYAVNIKDVAGTYRLVNRTFCAWFGVEAKRAIGHSVREVIPDGCYTEQMREADVRVLGERVALEEECALTLADGAVHRVRYLKFPIYDAEGALVGVCTTATDVTQASLTAERLRATRDLLARAFRATPAAIAISTLDLGRHREVNDQWLALFGWSREEAIGETSEKLGIRPEPTERRRLIAELVANGSVHGVEMALRARDGTLVDTLISAELFEDQGEQLILFSVIDIRERKRAEQALEEAEARYRAFLAASSDGVLRFEVQPPSSLDLPEKELVARIFEDSIIAECNDTFAQMHGMADAREAEGMPARNLYDDEREGHTEIRALVRAAMHLKDYETRVDLPDGGVRYLSENVVGIVENGYLVRGWTVIRDMTARALSAAALRASEARFRAVFTATPIGMELFTATGEFIEGNIASYRGFGEPTPGKRFNLLEDPNLPDHSRAALLRGEVVQEESWYDFDALGDAGLDGRGKRGRCFLRTVDVPLCDPDGRITAYLSIAQDETERLQAEEALRASEQRFRALYDDNPSIFLTLDAEGIIISVNRFGCEQLGYSPEELIGQPVALLHDPGDARALKRHIRRCLRNPGKAHRWESARRDRDGQEVWVRETARAVQGANGQTVVLCVCEDISETRALSEKLSYQASHDALTGLPNRREFEQRLDTALRSAHSKDSTHALAYIDLDQFKVVNDTSGHVAGDELLRQLAQVLQQRVRRGDTLARLGGDEFGLLMLDCSIDHARKVCDTLRESLAEFRFVWKERSFNVGASIGLVGVDSATGSVSDTLSAADAACYAAKERGRNRVHLYRLDDAQLQRRQGEMQWVSRIEEALAQERFELYYQPILRTGTNTGPNAPVRHIELLLRLRDNGGEQALPGDFLGAAERYNLAPRLDRWVVRSAAEWLAGPGARVDALELCAINLSALSINDDGFLEQLVQTFAEYHVPLSKICFEITETAVISNLSAAQKFIERLRAEGCHFALDDFGSGLSSFAYLKHLPADFLKIDGVFVKDIAVDPMDRAIVRSINEIGHLTGKRTIAEFVEDEDVLGLLGEIGVDFVQGYAIGHPRPLHELAPGTVRSRRARSGSGSAG